MIPALDISQYQGSWQDRGDPIVMIKMSGGDNGLYMDSQAASNYTGAVADGRAVGGYHINGWVLGAAQEASWFYRAMSPVAENDVFAIDIEKSDVPVPTNGPQYVMDQINYLATKGIVGGLLYMSLSTLNAFDWSGPLSKWGLWLADWAVSPDDNIPTTHVYVMQQYSDGPVYDHDEWFGTIDEFKAYGYHASQPTTTTTTTTTTLPPETTTTTESTTTTTSSSTTTTLPPIPNPPVKLTFWQWLLALLRRIA